MSQVAAPVVDTAQATGDEPFETATQTVAPLAERIAGTATPIAVSVERVVQTVVPLTNEVLGAATSSAGRLDSPTAAGDDARLDAAPSRAASRVSLRHRLAPVLPRFRACL